jgi:hypothetical protein
VAVGHTVAPPLGPRRGDQSYKPRNKFSPYQLCGRTNYQVFKCYKRFDPTYKGEEKCANASGSYGVDSNWYADLSTTNHITRELDKLIVKTMIRSISLVAQVCGRDSASTAHVSPCRPDSRSSTLESPDADTSLVAFGSVSVDSLGSSTAGGLAVHAVPSRPGTRLQHGIQKPKVYMEDVIL